MWDGLEFERIGRPVGGLQRVRCGPDKLHWLWSNLRALDFFNRLDKSERHRFAPAVSMWLFPANHVVIEEGADSQGLFVLYQGRVVVSRLSPLRGYPMAVQSLLPGDFFGEIALLEKIYRTATVTTTDPSAIFVIQADQFRAILDANPDLDQRFRRIAAERRLDLEKYA
jgi:CRP-like cAMP-binding protein